MLKKFILSAICGCCLLPAVAQPLKNIVWQHSFGGTRGDYGVCGVELPNGNIVVGGIAESDDGDMAGNRGHSDLFLASITPDGSVAWKHTYGGSDYDDIAAMAVDSRGQVVVAVYSESEDGDITNHISQGDAWLLTVDKDGAIVRSRNYGGSDNDIPTALLPLADGGMLMTGAKGLWRKNSAGENQLSNDLWLMKMDADGNVVWDKTYGGSKDDAGLRVLQMADGYVVCGATNSEDEDLAGIDIKGYADGWVMKLDAEGKIQWQQTYGGDMGEELMDIAPCANGDYLVLGYSYVSEERRDDAMLLRIGSNGQLVWQKYYGGTSNDYALRMLRGRDGSLMIAGATQSADGDLALVPNLKDNTDGSQWLFMINEWGNLLRQRKVGGMERSVANDLILLQSGTVVCIGRTSSPSGDGDVAFNHSTEGTDDIWVYQLQDPTAVADVATPTQRFTVYPSVSGGLFHISTDIKPDNSNITVTDLMGRTCSFTINATQNGYELNLPEAASGTYFITCSSEGQRLTNQVVVSR